LGKVIFDSPLHVLSGQTSISTEPEFNFCEEKVNILRYVHHIPVYSADYYQGEKFLEIVGIDWNKESSGFFPIKVKDYYDMVKAS